MNTSSDAHCSAPTAHRPPTTRGEARSALRDDLEAINRTARVMSDEVPGIDDKFRIPRGENDMTLLNAARAFAEDAAPFSAQFIAHELPKDFLTDMNNDIAAMETAMSNQSGGVGSAVAARVAIEQTVDEGVVIKRKLDAIVKNKYANNPSVLAEWASVSHTERAPRHKAASPPPPATTGAGGTPPQPAH